MENIISSPLTKQFDVDFLQSVGAAELCINTTTIVGKGRQSGLSSYYATFNS